MRPERTAARMRAGRAALWAMSLALAGCDSFAGPERRIERAAEAFEAGDYRAAIGDVKSALEEEPDNVGGRLLLARISLKTGDFEAARKELDRASEAGADPARVRELHYPILLAEGRHEDALIAAAADEGLEPLQRLLVQAEAAAALGRHDEAAQAIAGILEQDPGNRKAMLLQAREAWFTGRPADARTGLEKLVEAQPEYAEAWLNLARVRGAAGDAEGARAAFRKAIEFGPRQMSLPDVLSARAGLVESFLLSGDLDGADAALKSVSAEVPDSPVVRLLNARLALARGDARVAVAELQRFLSQRPEYTPARLLLASALFAQGSREQAESELTRLLAEEPGNVEARKLLARVYLARDNADEARRVLANAPTGEAPDAGADWLGGSAAIRTGKVGEGIALLERAAAADAGNVDLKLDLATAYLTAGRREDALTVLGALPEGQGGLRRRQLTVLAEVTGRPPAAAREGVLRLVQENPRDPELLSIGAYYFYSTGDERTAVDLFERAVSIAPDNAEVRIGLAAAALRKGDKARAEAELRKALEADKSNERAYIGLAGVAASTGDRAAAARWLEQAVSANPGAVESRLLLAELAMAEQDATRMKSFAEQALSVTKDRPGTLNRVGQLYLRASRFDEALASFSEAGAAGLDEAAVNAARALVALGRKDEARAALESLASGRRNWAPPIGLLVGLDLGEGKHSAALARVDAFERAGGAAVVAAEMRGDVQRAAGRPAEAAAAYQEALESRPTAALAYKAFDSRRAARQVNPEASLVAWLEQNPRDAFVRFQLAEHRRLTGPRKAAIAEYERALEFTPNPVVMNNLAWLYYEDRDPRALDLARRAYEADPASASVADTYGWILVEGGKVGEGLPILEKAAKAAPRDPEVQYHFAAALARVGRREEAATALRALLEGAQRFPSRAEAEKLLGSL